MRGKMKLLKHIALSTIILFVVASCSLLSSQDSMPLNKSENYYQYLQPTYSAYLEVTERWLSQNRAYISTNHQQELEMNMPFERGDKEKSD